MKNEARLVAQCYNKEEGIDYDETYAPVVRLDSIHILLAFSYYTNFKLYQMDVKSSFLNDFIKETIFLSNLQVLNMKNILIIFSNLDDFIWS